MRTVCCALGGGLVLIAGIALAEERGATDQSAAVPVETSVTGAIDGSEIERVDECVDAMVCIDRYLWSLYQRTQKIDTIKLSESVRVAVKQKGKIKIVTRTTTKWVTENFAWKDPEAAKKREMSPVDYVIGGMDPAFRTTLYRALRRAEEAGFMPGITSAFRDDYRQSIASGQKAQSDRSFHGGSFRGGYGHGQAADIVSVRGATREERQASSDELWHWVDTHEKELGIARPYLDRDAPHVGPFGGEEYMMKRGDPKLRLALRNQAAGKVLLTDKTATETARLTDKKGTAEKKGSVEKTHSAEKNGTAENTHLSDKKGTAEKTRLTDKKGSAQPVRTAERPRQGDKPHIVDTKAKNRQQKVALRGEHPIPVKRARAVRPARAQSRTHST
jgi:hypothetical protein